MVARVAAGERTDTIAGQLRVASQIEDIGDAQAGENLDVAGPDPMQAIRSVHPSAPDYSVLPPLPYRHAAHVAKIESVLEEDSTGFQAASIYPIERRGQVEAARL
jgi:hypothetical protein